MEALIIFIILALGALLLTSDAPPTQPIVQVVMDPYPHRQGGGVLGLLFVVLIIVMLALSGA